MGNQVRYPFQHVRIHSFRKNNQPTPAQVTDRIGFYQRYVQLLGTTPGTNLTCDKMKSY